MKRYGVLALWIALTAVLLAGCASASGETEGAAAEPLRVVSTIFPPYDFARAVTGGDAELTMLLSPGAESHSFDPTPADILTIQKCDVFLYVGGESEAWAERILASLDTSKLTVVRLMDSVQTLEEALVEGMDAGGEAPEEGETDEHIWTSPVNAEKMLHAVADALCECRPQCAEAYRANERDYAAKLNELDASYREVIGSAKRKTVVFGDRFPFRYLAEEYGLEYRAAFPGCGGDSEPSVATMVYLVNYIRDNDIPVVFGIEFSTQKIAKTLSEETGAKILTLHSCHNVTRDDFDAGVTYLDIMTDNLAALREALS